MLDKNSAEYREVLGLDAGPPAAQVSSAGRLQELPTSSHDLLHPNVNEQVRTIHNTWHLFKTTILL